MLEWMLLLVLLYFSWEDIRTREVKDEVVYAVFWAGVALNILKGFELAYSLVFTLVVGVVLHLFGVIALGDVWMGLIIAGWVPSSVFGVPLAVLSLLGGSTLGALYGIARVLAERRADAKKYLKESLALAVPFSVHPLLGVGYAVLRRAGIPLWTVLILFFFGVLFRGVEFLKMFFVLGGVFLVWSALFFSLKHSKEVFTGEKEPEEGDIPAEIVDEEGRRWEITLDVLLKVKSGEVKPIHNIGADGLTKEDVERLKSLGVKRIKVKESIPLIPFIAVAYFILLLVLEVL